MRGGCQPWAARLFRKLTPRSSAAPDLAWVEPSSWPQSQNKMANAPCHSGMGCMQTQTFALLHVDNLCLNAICVEPPTTGPRSAGGGDYGADRLELPQEK